MSTFDDSQVWGRTAEELCNTEVPKTEVPRMRDYVLDHVAIRLLNAEQHDSEIIADMLRTSKECCVSPTAITETWVRKVVTATREKLESAGKIKPIRPGEDRQTGLSKCIIPGKGHNSGIFPRGAVSLFAGASGAGKTIFFCHWLEALRQGREFLKYPAVTAKYRIVILDRTVDALRETLTRPGIDADEVCELAEQSSTESFRASAADALESFLLKWRNDLPDILFLEGIDFAVDRNDPDAIFAFIKAVEPMARLWGVAIVASTGSPKQKVKQEYTLARDQIIGSSAWGRVTDTIVVVQADGDGRRVTILSRNDQPESAWFVFRDRQVVITPDDPKETAIVNAPMDRLESYNVMKAVIETVPVGKRLTLSKLFPEYSAQVRGVILTRLELEGLVGKVANCWVRTVPEVKA